MRKDIGLIYDIMTKYIFKEEEFKNLLVYLCSYKNLSYTTYCYIFNFIAKFIKKEDIK